MNCYFPPFWKLLSRFYFFLCISLFHWASVGQFWTDWLCCEALWSDYGFVRRRRLRAAREVRARGWVLRHDGATRPSLGFKYNITAWCRFRCVYQCLSYRRHGCWRECGRPRIWSRKNRRNQANVYIRSDGYGSQRMQGEKNHASDAVIFSLNSAT
jgi:hypothetical protein